MQFLQGTCTNEIADRNRFARCILPFGYTLRRHVKPLHTIDSLYTCQPQCDRSRLGCSILWCSCVNIGVCVCSLQCVHMRASCTCECVFTSNVCMLLCQVVLDKAYGQANFRLERESQRQLPTTEVSLRNCWKSGPILNTLQKKQDWVGHTWTLSIKRMSSTQYSTVTHSLPTASERLNYTHLDTYAGTISDGKSVDTGSRKKWDTGLLWICK